jgi:hypothetical protein
LKVRYQRLTHQICLALFEIKKNARQRLDNSSLTPRNVATIFFSRTQTAQTAMAGWGARTRTQISLAKWSLNRRANFPVLGTFADQKLFTRELSEKTECIFRLTSLRG